MPTSTIRFVYCGAIWAAVAAAVVTPLVLDYLSTPTPAERRLAAIDACALRAVQNGAEVADARRRCSTLFGVAP